MTDRKRFYGRNRISATIAISAETEIPKKLKFRFLWITKRLLPNHKSESILERMRTFEINKKNML